MGEKNVKHLTWMDLSSLKISLVRETISCTVSAPNLQRVAVLKLKFSAVPLLPPVCPLPTRNKKNYVKSINNKKKIWWN